MTEAKRVRSEIGAEILLGMKDVFPIPNKHELAREMIRFFNDPDSGFIERLEELGYTWRPTEQYNVKNLPEYRSLLRKDYHEFLEYYRPQGSFIGSWRFVTKSQYIAIKDRERVGIETRIEGHNDNLNDAGKRWKLQVPFLGVEHKLIQGDLFEDAA